MQTSEILSDPRDTHQHCTINRSPENKVCFCFVSTIVLLFIKVLWNIRDEICTNVFRVANYHAAASNLLFTFSLFCSLFLSLFALFLLLFSNFWFDVFHYFFVGLLKFATLISSVVLKSNKIWWIIIIEKACIETKVKFSVNTVENIFLNALH